MQVSIIAIGDELLIGQVVDTNSGWIARHLNPLGWNVKSVKVIGDDSNEIFNYYFSKKQYFVIRLTEKRKIYRNHKWYKITTLREAYKGKIRKQ